MVSSSETPPAPARLLTLPYLLLFAAKFFFILNISIFLLLPRYLELRGASEGFYGAVAGSIGLASFASVLLLGHRGDRWGRKFTVSFYLLPALLGNGVAIWAMDAAPEWYFLSRILHGVTMGLGFPIVFTWVTELSPPERRMEALAYFGMAGLTANTLGPLLGELILSAQGTAERPEHYRWVYVAATGLLVLSFLIFQAVPSTHPPPSRDGPSGLWPLVKRRKSVLVLAIALCFGGVFGTLMAFGKTYTASLGLEFASVLFGAFSVGAVISRIFIRVLIRYFPSSAIIPVGLAGAGLSFILLGLAGGYPMLIAAGATYGLSHGILYPALNVRFFGFHSPSEMGRASLLYSGVFSGGTGLFPWVGGAMVGVVGYGPLFACLAAVAFGAIGLHFLVERTLAREPRDVLTE